MQMINHKPCRFRIPAYTLWLCLAAPSLCYANIGVPMIFVTLPMMVVALLPIIIIETVLATPYLKIPFRFLLRLIARANLFSTFVGIPITWFLLALVGSVRKTIILDGSNCATCTTHSLFLRVMVG